jgi:DNA polymerase delta subunit 3
MRSQSDMQVGRGPTKNASTASSSKTTLDALKPVVPQSSNFPRKSEQVIEKVKREEGPKEKDSAKPLAGTKEQSKPSGKLDWSRAKSKEQETTVGSHGKDKTNPQPNQELKPSLSSAKLADKPSRNRGFGPQSKMKSNPNPVALEPKVCRHYLYVLCMIMIH